MSGAELIALAERVEAATGPDRELDALIAYQHLGFYVKDEGHPLGRCCYDTHGIAVELPRYTASLDAAMTLVPEGWGFKADSGLGWGTSFTVGHIGPDKLYDQPEGWASAATPALALTAAALRARATQVPA